MSVPNTSDTSPSSTQAELSKPKKFSGVRTALKYTGIPASWLDKRPKLPSRNWLIFLSVTSSIAGLYIYDRRECKRIRQLYVDRVSHLAEQPVGALDTPRRVTVYGAKWPGDEDYDQSIKYFRKYVKPILVAAAVDYDMITGKRHGELATRIAEQIRLRRRLDLGLDTPSEVSQTLPTYKPLAELRKHELEGGIVIVGRPTLKEFMAGLSKGWTNGLDKIDHDEILAKELETDGHFDEPEDPENTDDNITTIPSEKTTLPSASNSPVYSPLQLRPPPPSPRTNTPSPTIPASLNAAPTVIPPLPPLLLVSFTNYIGFSQIPIMIWEFFNQRFKVQSGAEAGYKLVMNQTRAFIPPSTLNPSSEFEPSSASMPPSDPTPPTLEIQDGDCAFDRHVESYYKNSLNSIPADTEKVRRKYYEALPAKLATARALARGTREPTKEELEYPPPTEVELTAERMKKEARWRSDVAGWEIVRPAQGVVWDERFEEALSVFTDPVEESGGSEFMDTASK
ncbi:mitochondrial import inner membrane translocase subunit TIM54 [Infundibulicybe gibba]|nr:mitochondrial import inner membrane translocase subunit TIM54 [Infundibulicybe gibba]